MGTALLQLGAIAGLRMYATASKSKHAVITSFGGVPIDYQTENFSKRIRGIDRRRRGLCCLRRGWRNELRRSYIARASGEFWFAMARRRRSPMENLQGVRVSFCSVYYRPSRGSESALGSTLRISENSVQNGSGRTWRFCSTCWCSGRFSPSSRHGFRYGRRLRQINCSNIPRSVGK